MYDHAFHQIEDGFAFVTRRFPFQSHNGWPHPVTIVCDREAHIASSLLPPGVTLWPISVSLGVFQFWMSFQPRKYGPSPENLAVKGLS